MPLPSFSSSAVFRLLTLLAVIYAIVAGAEIRKTIHSATYNREILPPAFTAPLEGTREVEYAFTAEHDVLQGLWVFFQFPSDNPALEGQLSLSMRRVGSDAPFWSQSFTCRRSEFIATARLLRIEGLALERGTRYILTYAMPAMQPGTGWQLEYSRPGKMNSTLCWDGQVYPAVEPSMLWLERMPRYPIRNVLAGLLLLALCSIAARESTRLHIPAIVISATLCGLCATYYWQTNLWIFWGSFWPDGYVGLSYKIYQFLTGQISLHDCVVYFQQDRTAQVFLLPAVIGLFQAVGLSVKGAFLAANGVFLTLATAVLLALLRLFGVTSDRSIITAVLLFFGHRCVIGAFSEFQSDLAGAAMAMGFVYTLLRAFAAEDSRRRLRWYLACGVAGFLTMITRLALLPLPLIPLCLFSWSLACERQRPARARWAYLIPAAVGVALICASWSLLGLWQTLQLNWDFASTFTTLFSWKGFFINSVLGMQWSLLIVLLFWRRLFSDRAFVAVAGSAAGLLALLIYSRQPNWLRYHDAAAALGILLLVWPLKEWPRCQPAFLALAWVSVLANAFIP